MQRFWRASPIGRLRWLVAVVVLVGLARPLPAGAKDLLDTMAEMRSFCAFLSAVRAAGLEEELRRPGPFTLFVPTDEAFAALPPEERAALLRTHDRGRLAAMVRRHILPGRFTAHDLAGRHRWAATAAGSPLLLDGTSGQLMVDDEIEVLYADVIADNGVLHIIDGVVLRN